MTLIFQDFQKILSGAQGPHRCKLKEDMHLVIAADAFGMI